MVGLGGAGGDAGQAYLAQQGVQMRYGQIEGVIVRLGQEGHLALADPLDMDMLGDVEQLTVPLPLRLA